MMKFVSNVVALALLIAPALSQSAMYVTYDTTYDNPSLPLDDVACSNGPNGLEHLGYTTLGSLPNFPFVGGCFAVTGWDSTGCGTCWEITYEGRTITILAVDTAPDDFNLSQEAMDVLTNGQAVLLGHVLAAAVQVDRSECAGM